MKHKHLDCLMQDLHNISQMIADDILQRSEAAREVQEVLDTMRMTLLNRKCPLRDWLSMRSVSCGQNDIDRCGFTVNR
jgi:hypothetical protein